MFGIKEKLIAFLALIVGIFAIKSKFQDGKIEDLEDENKRFEKENTIEKAMRVAEKEIEKEEIMAKSHIDSSDWRNNI